MSNNTEKLTEIMTKIAYKVPWKKVEVSENEFRILDNATGEEMAQIAYENRIPFARFIHNADEIIDEFNEHKFRQYIRDVRELKKALEAPIQIKEVNKLEIEPIETIDPSIHEQEIMQAAINEVLEGTLGIEGETSELDIPIEEYLAGQKERRAAISHAAGSIQLMPSAHLNSVSIPRHDISQMVASINDNITLPDNIRKDPMQIGFDNDLPDVTIDQLAEMGMLDGTSGRKIFDVIYEREKASQSIEVRRTDENVPEELSNIVVEAAPTHENEFTIDQQVPQNSISHNSIDDNQSYLKRIEILTRPIEVPQDAPVRDEQAKKKKTVRRVRNRRVENTGKFCKFNKPLVVKLPKKPPKLRKRPNLVGLDYRNLDLDILDAMPNYVDYELVEDEYDEEIDIINQGSVVVPNVSTKRPIPSPDIEVENERKRQKEDVEIPKVTNISAQKSTDFSIPVLETMEKINELAFSEIHELPQEIIEVPLNSEKDVEDSGIQKIAESSEIQKIAESSGIQKIAESSEIQKIAESSGIQKIAESSEIQKIVESTGIQRIAESSGIQKIAEDSQIPQISENSNISHEIEPVSHLNISKDPQLAFRMFRARNKPVEEKPYVTQKDFEYCRLIEISKQKQSNQELPTIQEQPLIAEPAQANALQPSGSILPDGYKEFKKKGVEFIQFRNIHNNLVKHEEYNLENFLLYVQVRNFMKKKGVWRANVDDMIDENVLKLLDPNASKNVLEIRLWRLCESELLKGKWTDDCMKLIEVEIPVRGQSEDKENVY